MGVSEKKFGVGKKVNFFRPLSHFFHHTNSMLNHGFQKNPNAHNISYGFFFAVAPALKKWRHHFFGTTNFFWRQFLFFCGATTKIFKYLASQKYLNFWCHQNIHFLVPPKYTFFFGGTTIFLWHHHFFVAQSLLFWWRHHKNIQIFGAR